MFLFYFNKLTSCVNSDILKHDLNIKISNINKNIT